jgi:hypothetical protein
VVRKTKPSRAIVPCSRRNRTTRKQSDVSRSSALNREHATIAERALRDRSRRHLAAARKPQPASFGKRSGLTLASGDRMLAPRSGERSEPGRDGLRWDAIRRQLGRCSALAETVVRSLATTDLLRVHGAPESRPYDKGKGSRSGHVRRGAETNDRIPLAEEAPQ